jgi:pimeloyl-ACP methyl ester carboxylesterase
VSAGRGLAFDRYTVDGCSEWMMRIGAAEASPILFVPPLFEEMNRTRALIAAMMRALAAEGHGCWLPDLPGTGERAHHRRDQRAGAVHLLEQRGNEQDRRRFGGADAHHPLAAAVDGIVVVSKTAARAHLSALARRKPSKEPKLSSISASTS